MNGLMLTSMTTISDERDVGQRKGPNSEDKIGLNGIIAFFDLSLSSNFQIRPLALNAE